MTEPFRFAVVGSGNMAKTYAGILDKLPGIELAAIVSRSGRRPEGAAAAIPVAASLAEVAVPFDAVILTTPNGMHHVDAVEAAGLGKHVLTEKGLDVTTDAMDQMTRACADANVRLGVTFQRRVAPDNRSVKQLLDEGALGRVFGVDLAVRFYRDQAYYDSAPYRGDKTIDGGGPFMQQALHNVDIYCWFFGMPKTVVSMLGTFTHEMEGEDYGVALLRHPDGMIGSITASTATQPGFPGVLSIFAEKGSIVMENDAIVEWYVDGLAQPVREGAESHSGASSAAVNNTEGHEAIVTDFVEAVRTGREPMVPAGSARLATELVLKIYAANT